MKPVALAQQQSRPQVVYIVHADPQTKQPRMYRYEGTVDTTILGEIWTGKILTWTVSGRSWLADDSIPMRDLSTSPVEALEKWRTALAQEHHGLMQRIYEIDRLLAREHEIEIP